MTRKKWLEIASNVLAAGESRRTYRKRNRRTKKRESEPVVLLRLANELCGTNLSDPSAVDTGGLLEACKEVLKAYPEEYTVIELRAKDLTYREIAIQYGVTPERVRQRRNKALRLLRRFFCFRRVLTSIMGWPNLYRES